MGKQNKDDAKQEHPPIGVRVYSDGTNQKSGLWEPVATATLLLYTGWMHILLALIIASFFSKIALVITIALFSTLLLPAKPVLWQAWCRSWVFSCWRRYFSFSYLFEEILEADKRYVFCEFPHGVFPMGPLVAGTLCQVLFPGFNIYSIAASSVFHIPGWRHFIAWVGSLPATSHNFKKLLRKGSVAVIVGGVAEIFLQHPSKERIKLKDRKGFVRIAVEEGADGVVPVYHFGNTQLLDFGPASLEGVSRKLRAALGFLYGRMGLPLPRKKEVYMVTGKSIPVKRLARDHPGFDAEVDRVHALVVKAVQELYDCHKGEFGWEHRPLEIL